MAGGDYLPYPHRHKLAYAHLQAGGGCGYPQPYRHEAEEYGEEYYYKYDDEDWGEEFHWLFSFFKKFYLTIIL